MDKVPDRLLPHSLPRAEHQVPQRRNRRQLVRRRHKADAARRDAVEADDDRDHVRHERLRRGPAPRQVPSGLAVQRRRARAAEEARGRRIPDRRQPRARRDTQAVRRGDAHRDDDAVDLRFHRPRAEGRAGQRRLEHNARRKRQEADRGLREGQVGARRHMDAHDGVQRGAAEDQPEVLRGQQPGARAPRRPRRLLHGAADTAGAGRRPHRQQDLVRRRARRRGRGAQGRRDGRAENRRRLGDDRAREVASVPGGEDRAGGRLPLQVERELRAGRGRQLRMVLGEGSREGRLGALRRRRARLARHRRRVRLRRQPRQEPGHPADGARQEGGGGQPPARREGGVPARPSVAEVVVPHEGRQARRRGRRRQVARGPSRTQGRALRPRAVP